MKAVIALGANLEDPEQAVEIALALLAQAGEVLSASSLYKTKPVGGPEQGDYFNAVALMESDLPPHELLHLLQGIEKSMGRVRSERWGPRIIDLDLITYADFIVGSAELTLPHPRAHERRFVLEPWMEIDPEASIPGLGPIATILAKLPAAE